MKAFMNGLKFAINGLCFSSGVSCIIKVYEGKLTNEMTFVIGSLGVLQICYALHETIKLINLDKKGE